MANGLRQAYCRQTLQQGISLLVTQLGGYFDHAAASIRGPVQIAITTMVILAPSAEPQIVSSRETLV